MKTDLSDGGERMNQMKRKACAALLRRVQGSAFWRLLVPSLFFFGLIFALEMLFKAFCGMLSLQGVLLTALFSLPAAMLLGLLCGGVGGKAGRVLLAVCSAAVTVWIGVQMVYFDLFKTCLSLFSLTMAGMVMGDFGTQTANLIVNNLPRILLFLALFALSVILGKKLVCGGERSRKACAIWGGGALAAHILAVLLVLCLVGGTMSVRYLYTESDSVDMQAGRFGVLTATRLELQRNLFPREEVPAVEELPVAPVEPPVIVKPDEEVAEKEPEPIVYGDNVLDIDFEALIANETDSTVQKMHQYFSAVPPTKQNEWTGYFAGKNLIWIVAEAYSSIAIDPELTPTLYRLSQEGFHFNNFYTPSWGVSTSDGEYTTTTGLIPKSGVWSYLRSAENAMPFGFGHLFGDLGYRTLAYHNHSYTYYGRDKSHPNMGYEFYGVGNGLEMSGGWPRSDVEMMEKSVPQYVNEEQFMVYYLTVSGHLEYNFPGNSMATKHKAEVAHLPYSEAAKAYMACQMELDQALESLISQLDAAGKLEDTVIVLSGDHYPYGLSNEQFSELLGHAVEPNFELYKSRLLLWNAGMEESVEVDKYCSSLDVMPTLANLFALPYDSRLVMGRDIFSDAPGLVIFKNRSFLTDTGAYNASRDTFTTWDGSEADYDYVRAVLADVDNRFAYSRLILEKDYYAKLFPEA